MSRDENQRRPRPAQVAIELPCSELHRALGVKGSPATLSFASGGLTVATPAGTRYIRACATIAAAAGVATAGLRPTEADVLRGATDGPDRTVTLSAHPLTITLTGPEGAVTVGRW
jgi:hypothetical protein